MYQFPIPKRKAVEPTNPTISYEPAEATTLGLIQGRTPGSTEEWRVAVALNKLGIAYDYQVPIRGGVSVRGGQVVDFVVYNPYPQPLQVFGEYWHKGELDPEERLKLAVVEQYFGRPAVIFWSTDLQTQAQADEAVKSAVG